jgi:hypothetical protein
VVHRILFGAAALTALCAGGASAQRPTYDRHYLDSTEVFIAPDSTSSSFQYVAIGRVLTPPSPATRNEGQYLVVGGGASYQIGQRVWTRWVWRTRPATAPDAALGTTVFCLNKEANGVYQPPANRDEALNTGWWVTTITDVSDLYRQEVRAGEYRLGLECLRVSANAPTGAMGPPPAPAVYDGHFLDSAEHFISPDELGQGFHYVAVGRMVVGPTETSRGEAQFLVVGAGASYSIGQRVWTRYYWRTRQANRDDWTVGKQVFCLNAMEGEAYRGPRDRSEALNTGWWSTTITDLSDLYRQEVRAGEYRLGLGCLRVVR